MSIVKETLDTQFDFSNQPLNRYKPSPSTKGKLGVKNPRKMGGRNLLSSEEEIIRRHEQKIEELESEIQIIEDNIYSLEDDLNTKKDQLKESDEDLMAKEEMMASLIENYGEEIVDILGSGFADERKIREVRKIIGMRKDKGQGVEGRIVDTYNYYYPSEEEIEEINHEIEIIRSKIRKQRNIMGEFEKQIEALQNKIYNLENY